VDECKPLVVGYLHGVVVAAEEAMLTHHFGKAVHVDPMKPKLKPPGTKRLKLKCHILLSKFAFKFNLGCYTSVTRTSRTPPRSRAGGSWAGAYTRPLFSST